jgi:hypothetical protein
VAFPHHDTTHGDKGSSGETPLLGSEQTRDGDITSGPQLAIRLNGHTTTQVIENQRLVSLSKAQLPRKTGVFDTSPSGCSSTTIVTSNEDVIGLSLGDTTGNDTDADFGNEFDGYSRARVGAFQIVDELFEILNRVDVVVWEEEKSDRRQLWSDEYGR